MSVQYSTATGSRLEVFVEHCYRQQTGSVCTVQHCTGSRQQTGSVCRALLQAADWKCLYSTALLQAADWKCLHSTALLQAADWKCLYSTALLQAADWKCLYSTVTGTGSVCTALLQALKVFVEHCYRHWKCL